MKDTAFDVLIYLFEHYLHEDQPQARSAELEVELEQAGFDRELIGKAFAWLDGLAEQADHEPVKHRQGSLRIFAEQETERLDVESLGLIHSLSYCDVLNAAQRERVMERLMALDSDEIDIDQTKWVILMVLFNQPGDGDDYARMEQLLVDNHPGVYH